MKLAHLDVCNAVLLTGSVTGAAKLLHVSQPAVTKLLHSAENQLGFRLLRARRTGLFLRRRRWSCTPRLFRSPLKLSD